MLLPPLARVPTAAVLALVPRTGRLFDGEPVPSFFIAFAGGARGRDEAINKIGVGCTAGVEGVSLDFLDGFVGSLPRPCSECPEASFDGDHNARVAMRRYLASDAFKAEEASLEKRKEAYEAKKARLDAELVVTHKDLEASATRARVRATDGGDTEELLKHIDEQLQLDKDRAAEVSSMKLGWPPSHADHFKSAFKEFNQGRDWKACSCAYGGCLAFDPKFADSSHVNAGKLKFNFIQPMALPPNVKAYYKYADRDLVMKEMTIDQVLAALAERYIAVDPSAADRELREKLLEASPALSLVGMRLRRTPLTSPEATAQIKANSEYTGECRLPHPRHHSSRSLTYHIVSISFSLSLSLSPPTQRPAPTLRGQMPSS